MAEKEGNKVHCKFHIKLADIFGFCADFKKALYHCNAKITFQRKVGDEVNKFCFFNKPQPGRAAAAAVAEITTQDGLIVTTFAKPAVTAINKNDGLFGYVNIDKMYIEIPQEFLESKNQASFESQFLGGREVSMLYNKRSTKIPTLSGEGWQTIKLKLISGPPEMVLVCLIDNSTTNSYLTNSGLFTNFLDTISEINLGFGDAKKYPAFPLSKYDNISCINQLYEEYAKVSMKFGHLPQLTFLEFKNNYPFICFDLSKHDKSLFAHSVQLELNFLMKAENTKSYRVHVLYIENALMKGKLEPQGIDKLREVSFNEIIA